VANLNDNSVSVIDGAICNTTVTAGCGQTPATVPVGSGPDSVAVDQVTDTVYVANSNNGASHGSVSVINGATCNATVTTGCGRPPATVPVGSGPDGVAVDQATDTVYVANFGDENFGSDTVDAHGTVSVINGATCNASVRSGCRQSPATMVTGGAPLGVAVNQAAGTVYVSSIIDSDVDVFDGATCNATHHSGCGQTPAIVPTGGWPGDLAVDQATGTAYASDNVDGQVSFSGNPAP
jgi:DNA-binding beta-propeller fold protein YncE